MDFIMKRLNFMKLKYLIVLILLMTSFNLFSQTINYRTTLYSYKEINEYTLSWGEWSSFERSNMLITFDLNSDVVTVYSPAIQVYSIVEHVGDYYDSDNDYHMVFKFIDQDNDIGYLRLLQRTNGVSEIYIEFSNIKWCYRITRI